MPISFGIDTKGTITLSGDTHFVTPIGEFSIEAGVYKDSDEVSTLVVIRHIANGATVDSAYKIATAEELAVKTDGLVEIDITTHRIFIDASNGSITSLTIGSPGQIGARQSILERLQAFDDALLAADKRGDVAYLIDRLDPATYQFQYNTKENCIKTITRNLGKGTIGGNKLLSFQGPGSERYELYDQIVTIPNAYFPDLGPDPLHPDQRVHQIIGQHDGRLTWIIDCRPGAD